MVRRGIPPERKAIFLSAGQLQYYKLGLTSGDTVRYREITA